MIHLNKIKSYLHLMRFHRPVGILLLLWPTLWALWLAFEHEVQWSLVMIFILGVVFMRAAGCIINDIADRRFDGAVWRTKGRPLVTGEVSLKEAFVLLTILLILSAALLLWLPPLTWLLALVGVLVTGIYPLMKRYTHLPQLVLGVAFAWGVPMAFAAVTSEVTGLGWYVFLITAIWIVIYDTEYAMADREDDRKIGVKSTAILFGKYDRLIIGILQVLMITLLAFLGIAVSLNIFYFLSLFFVLCLFVYQQHLLFHRQPKNCLRAFINNQWVGLVVFLAILVGQY